MIDRELVNRKLVLIGRDLEDLAQLSRIPKSEYIGNHIYEAAAERYLERMVGRIIDINFHILVESGQAPPSDYYQSFVKLVGLGLYDQEFAETIAKSAGLRNRIAHEYDVIDAEQVYAAIQSAQVDVPGYISSVRDFLDTV